jgi:hypothetical protein
MRTSTAPQAVSHQPWTTGVVLFTLAFVIRLLFWQATPDAAWAHSAWYKGDASTWLEWARAIEDSRPFEMDLPIRPPGAAYFISALSTGEPSAIPALKTIWCLLGALTVGLLYAALRRSLGHRIAVVVALLCAGSTGMLILATSLNIETPYLALVAASLVLWRPVLRRRGLLAPALWAAVHAAAGLMRAEHLLYFGLLLTFLVLYWSADRTVGWKVTAGRSGLTLAVFALVLLPWHRQAWSAIARFNAEPLPSSPATQAAQDRLEGLLSYITWTPDALARLDDLPAATRRTARLFITATEGVRGGRTVTAKSVDVLAQAFGYIPEALPSHPYIALYGGLSFYLANNQQATGGFSRAPLDQPPRLVGGATRYPLALVRDLPPAQLTLTYPPHLEALNHGYSLGRQWIGAHPGDALRLAGRKLQLFWRGVALGIGGYNLPLGLSGVRRPVDLVVPDGGTVVLGWRFCVLSLVLLGAWHGYHRPEVAPWTLFLLSNVVVAITFFGYARLGVLVTPVVALYCCLAVERLTSGAGEGRRTPPTRLRWLVPAVAILLLAIETGRWASRPEVLIDGRGIGDTDPAPLHEHRERRIEVR